MKKYEKFCLNVDEALVISECVSRYTKQMEFFFDNFAQLKKTIREDRVYDKIKTLYDVYASTFDSSSLMQFREKFDNLSNIKNKDEQQKYINTYRACISDINPAYFDFIFKYDEVLNFLFENQICNNSMLQMMFKERIPSILPGEVPSVVEDYRNFTNYLLNITLADITKVNEVLKRISELGIRYFSFIPDIPIDGNYKVDFDYQYGKVNASMGVRTRLFFTDGNIGDIVQEKTRYSYTTHDANYLIRLVIIPANTKDFDLANNRGFYDEIIKCDGRHILTNMCRQRNTAIEVEDNIIFLNNLTFDPELLPKEIMLRETLYKRFPKLEKQIGYNKKLHDCEEVINTMRKTIEQSGVLSLNSEYKDLNCQNGRDLEAKYLELSNLLISSGNVVKEAYDRLVLKPEEK